MCLFVVPKLTDVSGKEAVKAFVKSGYKHIHTSGDHAILQKDQSPTLSIPLHKQVARFLLKTQIKRAGITEEEFIKFLKKFFLSCK